MPYNLEIPIYQWKCSFYQENKKKWNYGELHLNQDQVNLVEEIYEKEDKNEPTLQVKTITFSRINKISKAKSSFVYPCIVISLNAFNVWISSLESRDKVFNYLEHFWQTCLLDTRAASRYLASFMYLCMYI